MIRYLSAAWFDRLRDATGSDDAPGAGDGEPGAGDGAPEAGDGAPVVLRHVVRAADGGTGTAVDYDVVVAAGRAVIRHPAVGSPDLTFTSDWDTAAAIASGALSTQAALAEGRMRIAGDVSILTRRAADIAGLDPVPAGLRAETEYLR